MKRTQDTNDLQCSKWSLVQTRISEGSLETKKLSVMKICDWRNKLVVDCESCVILPFYVIYFISFILCAVSMY